MLIYALGDTPILPLQDEGGVLSMSKHQSLMRSAMTQLNLSARTIAAS